MCESCDLKYLAGIIDGEGCISIKKINNPNNQTSYTIQLLIVNTNPELLKFLHERFGGTVYGHKRQAANAKPIESLVWSGNDAERLLKRVTPFLIVKRKHVEVLGRFPHKGNHGSLTYNDSERLMRSIVWQEMRDLNKKGVSKEAYEENLIELEYRKGGS